MPVRLLHRLSGLGLCPISANLFYKHSPVAFTLYKIVLQDERRTSNNDVATLRNLISKEKIDRLLLKSGMVEAPAFCNRKNEQKEIMQYIENSQNVLHYSHLR